MTNWGHKGHCAKTCSPAKWSPLLSPFILISLPIFGLPPLIPFQTNEWMCWILDNSHPLPAPHGCWGQIPSLLPGWDREPLVLQSHTSISPLYWLPYPKTPVWITHLNKAANVVCFAKGPPKPTHVCLWTTSKKVLARPFQRIRFTGVCAVSLYFLYSGEI